MEGCLHYCVGRRNPSWMEVDTMRKLLTALVAAASIGAAAIATSSSAEAWRGGWGWGWGSRSCGWRSHCRCCRRERNRVAAVLLPVWLLRIRTKSLLRTPLRPPVERLRLGASLLVMN